VPAAVKGRDKKTVKARQTEDNAPPLTACQKLVFDNIKKKSTRGTVNPR